GRVPQAQRARECRRSRRDEHAHDADLGVPRGRDRGGLCGDHVGARLLRARGDCRTDRVRGVRRRPLHGRPDPHHGRWRDLRLRPWVARGDVTETNMLYPNNSLWELVERRAALTPDAIYAVDENGRTLTFAEYREQALRVAAGFQALGVGAETNVSWLLPTWLEALVLVGALARLGVGQSPMLPIYGAREVRFITKQTGCALLIVPSTWRGFDYEAMARTIAAENGYDVMVCDRALPEGDPNTLPPFVSPGPD